MTKKQKKTPGMKICPTCDALNYPRARICVNPLCPDHKAGKPFPRMQPPRVKEPVVTSDFDVIENVLEQVGGIAGLRRHIEQAMAMLAVLEPLGGLEAARLLLARLEPLVATGQVQVPATARTVRPYDTEAG